MRCPECDFEMNWQAAYGSPDYHEEYWLCWKCGHEEIIPKEEHSTDCPVCDEE